MDLTTLLSNVENKEKVLSCVKEEAVNFFMNQNQQNNYMGNVYVNPICKEFLEFGIGEGQPLFSPKEIMDLYKKTKNERILAMYVGYDAHKNPMNQEICCHLLQENLPNIPSEYVLGVFLGVNAELKEKILALPNAKEFWAISKKAFVEKLKEKDEYFLYHYKDYITGFEISEGRPLFSPNEIMEIVRDTSQDSIILDLVSYIGWGDNADKVLAFLETGMMPPHPILALFEKLECPYNYNDMNKPEFLKKILNLPNAQKILEDLKTAVKGVMKGEIEDYSYGGTKKILDFKVPDSDSMLFLTGDLLNMCADTHNPTLLDIIFKRGLDEKHSSFLRINRLTSEGMSAKCVLRFFADNYHRPEVTDSLFKDEEFVDKTPLLKILKDSVRNALLGDNVDMRYKASILLDFKTSEDTPLFSSEELFDLYQKTQNPQIVEIILKQSEENYSKIDPFILQALWVHPSTAENIRNGIFDYYKEEGKLLELPSRFIPDGSPATEIHQALTQYIDPIKNYLIECLARAEKALQDYETAKGLLIDSYWDACP